MDCGLPGPLSMGFSREEYWSGLPCPPSGDLPNPGIELASLLGILHWQAGSLPLVPPSTVKINKQKPQLKRVTRPEAGALTP